MKAVEVISAAAGSSAAKRGQRLQRYYRDVSMYLGHIAAQYLITAGELARVHFGLPDTLFYGDPWHAAPRRRSAPTTSGACCARPRCTRRGPSTRQARSPRPARAEDAAIRDAVRMQEEAGLQSATDGEFRRAEWHTDFITRLGGIRQAAAFNRSPPSARPSSCYDAHGLEVTGKVHLAEPIFGRDFSFLASAVTTATPKLTIPSPSMAHFRADLSVSGYSDS